MKKQVLYTGISLALLGAALLAAGAFWIDTPIAALLSGWGGGLLAPGCINIYRYLHWSKPQNTAVYEQKLKQEQIMLKDERNILLRNKAGRLAFLFSLCSSSLMLFILSLLHNFEYIAMPEGALTALYLVLLLQFASIFVAYRWLQKKY